MQSGSGRFGSGVLPVMRLTGIHSRGENPIRLYKCVADVTGKTVNCGESGKGEKHREQHVVNRTLSGFVPQKKPTAFTSSHLKPRETKTDMSDSIMP